MNMDPLPWAWCVRAAGLFLPFFFITAYPQYAFWQTQPPSSQCCCVFVWICTAQGWRYLMFLMPASGCCTACSLVWNCGEREQQRWIEGEAERVESERHRGKSPRTTWAHLRSAVQWCCGWRDEEEMLSVWSKTGAGGAGIKLFEAGGWVLERDKNEIVIC